MNVRLESNKVVSFPVKGNRVVDVYGYGDCNPKTFEYEFYRLCIGGRSLTNDVVYDLFKYGKKDFKAFVNELVDAFDKQNMVEA